MARTSAAFVLPLELEDGPAKLSQRLSAALVHTIATARLADGDTVPSTRAVAHNLQIARSVVVEAYEELIAAGFLVARPGSATLVGQGAVAAARAGAYSSAVAPPSLPQVMGRRLPYRRFVIYAPCAWPRCAQSPRE